MALRDGLLGDWTYETAKSWLLVECGQEVSSGALSGYWQHYCAPVLSERRKMAVLKAEEITRLSVDEAVDWDAAAMDRLKQLSFEFLMEEPGEVDSKAVARLMKLVLADRALKHDGRKLALLEEKVRAAAQAKQDLTEAASKAREGGVSEETIRAIEEAAGLL